MYAFSAASSVSRTCKVVDNGRYNELVLGREEDFSEGRRLCKSAWEEKERNSDDEVVV